MSDQQRMPSAWWFGVAAAIFALGLVPLALMLSNAVESIVGYDIQEFDSGNSTELSVDGGDVAIFSTHDGIGTVVCSGGGPATQVPDDPAGGAQATVLTLDSPTWDLEYSRGPHTWHRVAVTPDDWDDGTYRVTCNVASGDDSGTAARFAYADNPSFFGTIIGFLIALGVAALTTIIAAAIAIVVAVKRNRAKRPPLPRYPTFPTAPPR